MIGWIETVAQIRNIRDYIPTKSKHDVYLNILFYMSDSRRDQLQSRIPWQKLLIRFQMKIYWNGIFSFNDSVDFYVLFFNAHNI